MSNIERFEELDIWKKARKLANEIYNETDNPEFSQDYGLKDQIQRAATSIMSNIAEGFERQGDQEFAHYLSTALGSTAEVRSQLYLANDQNYISTDDFNDLKKQTIELTKMIKSFRNYLTK